MIDYFIHFIDKPFHLLLRDAAPSVHHRPHLADERGYFPRFTMLPTKDEFDQRQKRTPLSGRIVRGD